MNGPVDAASAEQVGVGSIHDGRNRLTGDAALHKLNAGGKGRSGYEEMSCNGK